MIEPMPDDELNALYATLTERPFTDLERRLIVTACAATDALHGCQDFTRKLREECARLREAL